MAHKFKRKSTLVSAARVKEIISQHYEPGRHDKCKKAIYRNYVYKQTGISESTFWRYMQEIDDENRPKVDDSQLSLF